VRRAAWLLRKGPTQSQQRTNTTRTRVTDPPYGIQLDSEWRDRAGLNGCGPAETSYMKKRTAGHTETTISGDTRADWSEAFELVPSLQIAYVWHASVFTREVLNGLLRIGFLYPQQIIWNKGRTVLTRTHYWYQHEPCWYLRKKNAPWFGKPGENSTIWESASPKFIMGGSDEEKFDHPTQKPVDLMRMPVQPFDGSEREGDSLVGQPVGGGPAFDIERIVVVDEVVVRCGQADRKRQCCNRNRSRSRRPTTSCHIALSLHRSE